VVFHINACYITRQHHVYHPHTPLIPIFSLNKSVLFKKSMNAVLANHRLLQMSSNLRARGQCSYADKRPLDHAQCERLEHAILFPLS
jgi:hypothetical protein